VNHLADRLSDIYVRLWNAYGPQHWWPAESPFEVMVGAVLTQNTNWQGVEKAIANLKSQGLLAVFRLHQAPAEELAELIRPAGYFNLKANRLKNLMKMVAETYAGDLQAMARVETDRLRRELLGVKGIGPETADSILLYAFSRPVFVVDAYTHRVMGRHDLVGETATYYDLQELFMEHLPEDVAMFNEFHALIVRVAKTQCHRKPRCSGCPLEPLLP
jgi:endonuclease-3 related protein